MLVSGTWNARASSPTPRPSALNLNGSQRKYFLLVSACIPKSLRVPDRYRRMCFNVPGGGGGAVGVDDVGGVVEVAAAVVAAQCVEIVVVGARG